MRRTSGARARLTPPCRTTTGVSPCHTTTLHVRDFLVTTGIESPWAGPGIPGLAP